MLGKDYMLAIIIVNYEDSPWGGASEGGASEGGVEGEGADLPSGWRVIRDAAGSYYWHVPTGTTQWTHPSNSHAHNAHALSSDTQDVDAEGRRSSRLVESPASSIKDRLSWQQDDYFCSRMDPNSKCFAVRSLGWVEIPEEELTPGKSSLAVNNCIQQLSHSKAEGRDTLGAWGEGQDMMMVLKRDTLSLLDPVDHGLLHCQPLLHIRVWGVGCTSGRDRDFAFVAGDKDTCMLKCHVFRCDAPAQAIATALHQMCSQMMSEKVSQHPSMGRSLTMESISPEDLPHQEGFLDAVRQTVQKFEVQYIGSLPVSRAMGMEVLNRAIESILSSTDRDEWEPITLHVSDKLLSLRRGEEGVAPFWECQVRYLTFLGVGHDTRTFAVIVDAAPLRFDCHVFWCQPDAGGVSEAVQAACMVQYQKCLVAQTPPPRSRMWRAGAKVKRANSMDSSTFPPCALGPSPSKAGSAPSKAGSAPSGKKGMLAFFETFRNKQSATPGP